MGTDYQHLGSIIAKCRLEALIANQGDLAKLIGTSQQTVSRWEAGVSKPRSSQIPKLSAVLGIEPQQLLEAAGYLSSPAVVSFDVPFPLEALQPESFERLTADLVQALHPEANVSRAGGQGHTQEGIDVLAVFPNGRRHTYQCKRVAEFGPAKVLRVIEKDTTVSDRKFLLLTRTASPEARAVVDAHPQWQLWDRDDISRKLRQLPLEELKRIVRIYFPGQQMPLLGISADSPWESVTDFFAAFSRDRGLFSHTWQLVGRDALVDQIQAQLDDPMVGMTLLTGAGGSGKSRLLKEVLERFALTRPSMKIRIASATMEITKASLDELGPGEVLLVVDDAHDRNDLQVLFNFAAANSTTSRLLISARRYGVEHIKAQASCYSFSGDQLAQIDLPQLSLADAEALALQVLEERGGPVAAANDIARLTQDCALATVVGAQIVAEDKIHPLLAQSEDRFRSTLFGRFESVVAGQLANREDHKHVRSVLGFLALVQPIAIDDKHLLAALELVEGIAVPETQRILKLLINAGVFFKRGSKYRLSPDVLGDFLIESHFEGPDGQSNGLAEQYFDALPETYAENLLLNMGRIDWRRAGQASVDSPLLNGVWAKLSPKYEYVDPHITAVKAVAYYQPKRALAFVEALMPEIRFHSQLADIAKYAAYSDAYLPEALECLWELGRVDQRDTNPHPSHPIRILTDLAEPQPGKPITVNETVLEFCIGLTSRPEAWTGRFTPLDVLDGVLKTEGHTNIFTRHAVTWTPFFIDPEVVRPLRERAIDFLIPMLRDSNTRKAVRAAKSLANATQRPIGLFGSQAPTELLNEWDEEFAATLSKIAKTIAAGPIDPLVQAEIGRTVGWVEGHGSNKARRAAGRIRRALSTDLNVRVDRVLIDGYGMEDRRTGEAGHDKRWAKYLSQIVDDLEKADPDSSSLVATIEDRIRKVEAARSSPIPTPEVLVARLIEESTGFADALLDGTLTGSCDKLSRFAGHALGKILRDDRAAGRSRMRAFLDSPNETHRASVGAAYSMQRFSDEWVTSADLDNLRELLASPGEWVVFSALRAMRFLSEWNGDVVVDLIRTTNIPTARVADEVAVLFEFGDHVKFAALQKDDVLLLLSRLEPLLELDGHWLQKFLARISEQYPWELARFFMRRVEAAVANSDMRPCNHGPWAQEKLRFRQSIEGPGIMREMVAWMRANAIRRDMFHYHSRTLFEAMFAPFDEQFVGFLSDWLAASTAEDISMIASLIREADSGFVFAQFPFVSKLVERAQQFGHDLRKEVIGNLYASGIKGMRHGTSGQPFPEDLSLKQRAEEVLGRVSRFSPVFELYDALRQHAEASIKRVLQDAEDDD